MIVTDGRILRNMTRAGFIVWNDAREKHWTGQTVKRRWVEPGPKLKNWYDPFTYCEKEYRLTYLDGCFHPFVHEIGTQRPSFI